MVLIQLDTGASLGFLRGTQLLSGSPPLMVGFIPLCYRVARNVGKRPIGLRFSK